MENRIALNLLLSEMIIKYKAQELLDKLNARKIPAGLVNSISAAISTYAGSIGLLNDGKIEGIRTFIEKGSKFSHISPPPKYGEHTSEILEKILGVSPSDILEIVKNGILSI